MNLNKVLVPTDGSKASYDVVDRAFRLAADSDASATVLEVVEDAVVESSMFGEPPAEADVSIGRAAERVDRLVSEAEERGVEADPVVKTGDPVDVIADVARKGGYDVVFMGSRYRDSIGGRDADEGVDDVLARSDTAVLTVPEPGIA